MVSPERQICQMSWCSSSQVNEDSKERRLRFIIDYYSIVIHQEALRWVLNGSHSTQLLHFGVSHKHPQRCQPSVSSECQSTWSLRELAANCYELLPGWCSSKRIQCHFPWWLFGSKARTPVKSFGCFTPIKGVCESIGKPQIAKLLVHLECAKLMPHCPKCQSTKASAAFKSRKSVSPSPAPWHPSRDSQTLRLLGAVGATHWWIPIGFFQWICSRGCLETNKWPVDA